MDIGSARSDECVNEVWGRASSQFRKCFTKPTVSLVDLTSSSQRFSSTPTLDLRRADLDGMGLARDACSSVGGPATAAGAKLGRYQIVKHLASGGMAEVLLARATGIE